MATTSTTGGVLDDRGYRARIRFTTHGVAHVDADDWGSLGYGQGWACARDHLGTILDQIVKVRGERAAHWGPGRDDALIAADLGYRVLDLTGRAGAFRDAQSDRVRALVTGYTAGINRAVAEADAGEWTAPEWCRGATWLRPVDEQIGRAHV